MKIWSDCKVRSIAGEKMILLKSADTVDMTRVVMLNSSAEFLFEKLRGEDFTTEMAASLLAKKYNLSFEKAQTDVQNWLAAMEKAGLITE